MKTSYKPEGHNSVSPYLVVDSAERAIAFLVEALDGVEILRHARPGGGIMHAEVRIDDTVVMLGESLEGWPAISTHVHVYVPDVDETYRRALAAGATSVQEPAKKQDADKRGGVKDPTGTTWWIATKVDPTS